MCCLLSCWNILVQSWVICNAACISESSIYRGIIFRNKYNSANSWLLYLAGSSSWSSSSSSSLLFCVEGPGCMKNTYISVMTAILESLLAWWYAEVREWWELKQIQETADSHLSSHNSLFCRQLFYFFLQKFILIFFHFIYLLCFANCCICICCTSTVSFVLLHAILECTKHSLNCSSGKCLLFSIFASIQFEFQINSLPHKHIMYFLILCQLLYQWCQKSMPCLMMYSCSKCWHLFSLMSEGTVDIQISYKSI